MPKQKAAAVNERSLGKWIIHNKQKEVGTNSDREQLMKREVPLASEISDRIDTWDDILESLNFFSLSSKVGGPVAKVPFFSNGPNITFECSNLLY